MKISHKIIAIALVLTACIPFTSASAASTPNLNITNSGTGTSVILTVTNADHNAPVLFYYTPANSSGIQSASVGTTDANGQFWTTINTSTYNVATNSYVYVSVDGAQSPSQTWPLVSTTNSNGGNLSLNQTSLVVTPGQSSVVTVTNPTGSPLYLLNNTNPPIANISINGNQVTVVANSNGSSVATVCAGSSTNCASLYITVQNGGTQALTFNQNNVTVAYGQTVQVTVTGGTGVYNITNNANSGIMQAYMSGNTVSLNAVSYSGTDAVTICSSDMSSCGIINASVGSVSSTGITFSQTNPTLSIGQNDPVVVSGGSDTNYYISSNSNQSVVSATMTGSTLNLYGSSSGTATLSICSNAGGCGTTIVTVGTAGSGGNLTLSQTSLAIVTGQAASITISGGALPYSIVSNSGTVVQTSLNSNILTVTGIASGTTNLTVCSGAGGCTNLYVSVNGSGSVVTTPPVTNTGSIAISPIISVGQVLNMTLSGGTGSYYLSSVPATPFTATLSGTNLSLYGVAQGALSINVCSSNATCVPLYVTVNASNGTTVTTPPPTTTTGASGKDGYVFNNPLTLGATGNDVTELQKRLTAEGVYTGPITGYYGSLTMAAVEEYQSNHGLSTLGNVGPGTRAALNGQ